MKVASSTSSPVMNSPSSSDQKLQIYGLFTLIKKGKCDNKNRPGILDYEAQQKYDAWSSATARYGNLYMAIMQLNSFYNWRKLKRKIIVKRILLNFKGFL